MSALNHTLPDSPLDYGRDFGITRIPRGASPGNVLRQTYVAPVS